MRKEPGLSGDCDRSWTLWPEDCHRSSAVRSAGHSHREEDFFYKAIPPSPSFIFFFRNNVLHLWPWVIEDLKSLGAKNFYPRFCTGTMNHISIRCLSPFHIQLFHYPFPIGGFNVSCSRLLSSLVLRYLVGCLSPASRSPIMTMTSGGYQWLQKNIQ